jgi:hypothetical protein
VAWRLFFGLSGLTICLSPGVLSPQLGELLLQFLSLPPPVITTLGHVRHAILELLVLDPPPFGGGLPSRASSEQKPPLCMRRRTKRARLVLVLTDLCDGIHA